MDVCDDTQGTYELSAKEQETIEQQKAQYEEEKEKVQRDWQLIKQPGQADDANCLIASVLNCVDTDRERRALLGMTQKKKKVDYQSSEAYEVYAAFFAKWKADQPKRDAAFIAKWKAEEAKERSIEEKAKMEKEKEKDEARAKLYNDKNLQYTSTGMYVWLEHLVESKILKGYTWQRVSTLEQGLGAWFGNKMRTEGKGKRYVIFGYHAKKSGTHQFHERLKRIRRANPRKQTHFKGNTGTWVKNMAKIIDRWAILKKRDHPPVEGLMGPDPEYVDEEARMRTFGGAKLPMKMGAVAEWCQAHGKTVAYCQRLMKMHRRRIVREEEERLRAEMHQRDITNGPGGYRDPFKPLAEIAQVDEEDQDGYILHKDRMKSMLKKAASKDSVNIVTLHGIAARCLDNGGVVIMDPAAQSAKYMHSNDVLQSCTTFLSACVYYWAVYEIAVEVA